MMDRLESNPQEPRTAKAMQRADFPTTNWTAINRFKGPFSTQHNRFTGDIYERYREPLYILSVRSLRLPPNDAQELVQDFFVSKVVEKNVVARADQSRGRFRWFISQTYINFVKDHWRSERAEAQALQRLSEMAESRDQPDALADITIEWSRSLIHHALDYMQSDCIERGRQRTWTAFRRWFVEPLMNGTERPSIDTLTAELNLKTKRQTYNRIETGKRTFSRHLRYLVSLYSDKDDVDAEIRELMVTMAQQ